MLLLLRATDAVVSLFVTGVHAESQPAAGATEHVSLAWATVAKGDRCNCHGTSVVPGRGSWCSCQICKFGELAQKGESVLQAGCWLSIVLLLPTVSSSMHVHSLQWTRRMLWL